MIGQQEQERHSKKVPIPVPILDLKAYNATTGMPRMKWHKLSQNQNKLGWSKY